MHPCTKFILFCNDTLHSYIYIKYSEYIDTLHVSDGLFIHHQQFKTVHTAISICQTDTDVCLLADSSICMVAVCTILNSR